MEYLNKADLICETIDNGIILLNENLEVLFWNRWLETRTNISFDQIAHKKITEVYPDINEAKLKRKIKATLTLNSPIVGILKHQSRGIGGKFCFPCS